MSKISVWSVGCIALLFFALFPATASSITQSLRSGGYFCGTDGSCRWEKPGDPNWLFQRFTYIMGYAECSSDIAEWRSKSPGCRLILYTSGTDMPSYKNYGSRNFNSGRKATWIRDRIVQLGSTEESAYMHFYNDTKLRDWNGSSYDTLVIRGTYSMTISAKDSVSRVPNSYTHYLFLAGNTYSDPARLSPNFANPKVRQANKEYFCQIFDATGDTEHWPSKTGYYDGVYLDNYAPWSMQGSNFISGGLIVETGTTPTNMLTYASQAYADWCWGHMQSFGRELRDTLQMADQWSVDHKKKYVAYNVAQTHRNVYLYPDSSGADALNYEFGWDPVFCNNSSTYRLENLYSRDSIASRNGVTSFWTSPPRTTYNGKGTATPRQAIYNNACFYYVARSDSTWIFMRPSLGNAYGVFVNPGFDTLSYVPAMDYELGWPAQHYQLAASGPAVDQSGGSYKVWSRQYPYGVVYIRPVDGFDAKWGSQSTPVTVTLGGSYRQLQTDGTLGTVVTQISLRGGEGAIMIPATTGQCTTPPTVPTLNSPANGATVASLTPSLCVNSSTMSNCTQPIRYHFQIATASSFAAITQENSSVAHSAGTSCWAVPTALAPGVTYYWRVRAGNGVSWSGWSSTGSFATTNTAPTVPALNSPANAATVNSRQPNLVVNNSTDPQGTIPTYQFQVSINSGFTTIAAQSGAVVQGTSTTSWQVAVQLNNLTTYYWRARSYDGVNYSSWSASRTFYVNASTSNTAPTTPTINAPANGASVGTPTPLLRVNNSTDANGNTLTYQFELYDSTLSLLVAISPMLAQGAGTTAWTVNMNLVNNIRYRWRARAYDGLAWSNYMTAADFRVVLTANSPPTVPVLLTPTNNQSIVGEPIMLMTNNSVDLDGDPIYYSFRVFSDSILSKQVEISNGRPQTEPYTTYYTTGSYLHNKPYWWTVRAFDGSAYSDWSTARKFVHLDAVLEVTYYAKLVSPAHGSEEMTSAPTFRISWTNSPDTVACLFEVSSDSQFHEIYEAGSVAGFGGAAEWVPQRPLENESTYYWRAKIAGGGYSETASFTVSSPIFVSPNPFSYLDGEITFHNLPEGSRLEVYTPSGDKVYEAENLGGDYKWNVLNRSGERLGSGVFLYYVIFDEDRIGDKFIVVR